MAFMVWRLNMYARQFNSYLLHNHVSSSRFKTVKCGAYRP